MAHIKIFFDFILCFVGVFVTLSVETIKHHDYDRRKTNIIIS